MRPALRPFDWTQGRPEQRRGTASLPSTLLREPRASSRGSGHGPASKDGKQCARQAAFADGAPWPASASVAEARMRMLRAEARLEPATPGLEEVPRRWRHAADPRKMGPAVMSRGLELLANGACFGTACRFLQGASRPSGMPRSPHAPPPGTTVVSGLFGDDLAVIPHADGRYRAYARSCEPPRQRGAALDPPPQRTTAVMVSW